MQIKCFYMIIVACALLFSPLSSYSSYDDEGYSSDQAQAPDDSQGYYSPSSTDSDDFGYLSTQSDDDTNYSVDPDDNSYADASDKENYYQGRTDAQDSRQDRHSEEVAGSDSRGVSYDSRLPQHITAPGEKVIIVDPRVHAFGAYSPDGALVRAGIATSGSDWCRDLHRRCRTKVGSFRIYSLGSSRCVSSKFPLGRGGAPMPYCMFFNGGQGLHGSYETAEANISHGCVRLHVYDAEWLRFNFVNIGTKVIIKPY